MKKLFKALVTSILVKQAKKQLKTSRTQVIGITGSVGKTSTKEAIFTVLNKNFLTYRSPGGFNTPLGLSLGILQEKESGFSSPIKWIKILNRVFREKRPNYKKMVLEMGADGPGDIKKLTKIAPPNIGIVTNVNPTHLADGQFKNLEDIAEEKSQIIKNMAQGGLAILNMDDDYVSQMEPKGKVLSYGVLQPADVRASDVQASNKNIKFNVTYKGKTQAFTVPVLGRFQVYVMLPAIATGVALGMTLEECAEALTKYKLPKGRMNPIEGINSSTILDGSYNASPTSVISALETLRSVTKNRKIAALGTMNELGSYTKEAHIKVGAEAAAIADMLITVGPEANTLKQGAVEAGMKEKDVYTFFDSVEAGHFLAKQLTAKDTVLVKGSQNKVRMEKLVKICMKEPEYAEELLCRQGDAWEKIG